MASIEARVSELLDKISTLTAGSGLPPLRVVCLEDGSTLVEWIFPDFRIGFSVEPIEADSCWWLVSNDKLGNIMQDGYMPSVDIPKLVEFAMEHSGIKV